MIGEHVSVLKPMLAWSNSLTRGFAETEARDAGKRAKSKALKKNKAMKKGVSAKAAEVIVKAAEKRYDAERAKYLAALQTFNASGLDASFAKTFTHDSAAEKVADADEVKERQEQLTLRKAKVAWTSPLPDLFSKVVTTSTTAHGCTNTHATQWGVRIPASVLVQSEQSKAAYALATLKKGLKHAKATVPQYTAIMKKSKNDNLRRLYANAISELNVITRTYPALFAKVEAYIASPQCRHSILLERTCELTGLIAMLEALVTSAATWATEQAEMEQFCSAQRAHNSAARAWESSCSSSDSDEDGMDFNFVDHVHIRRKGRAMPMPT